MVNTVKDLVFGEMMYKHAWVKMQDILMHGKTWNVKVMAAAYTGNRICEEQRLGYRYFKENTAEISDLCEDMIVNYVNVNLDDFSESYPEIRNIMKKNVSDYAVPKTVLFARDGSVVLLYDARWDEENGIGIEVYPKKRIGLQDEFL